MHPLLSTESEWLSNREEESGWGEGEACYLTPLLEMAVFLQPSYRCHRLAVVNTSAVRQGVIVQSGAGLSLLREGVVVQSRAGLSLL